MLLRNGEKRNPASKGKNTSAPSHARHTSAEVSDEIHIACRIPSGVTLRLYDQQDVIARHEAQLAGRPITALLKPQSEVTLAGATHDSRFDIRDNRILGMAGYTKVSRAFWEAWIAQNANCDLVKNYLIFAAESACRVNDQVSEMARELTGFEGLEPDRLPIPSVAAEKIPFGH